jgi:hypothetical protein
LTWRLQLLNENIVEDKSFADDLTIKQGIVSSRAKLILRGAEIKPLFSDLCFGTFLPHPQNKPKGTFAVSRSCVGFEKTYVICVCGITQCRVFDSGVEAFASASAPHD